MDIITGKKERGVIFILQDPSVSQIWKQSILMAWFCKVMDSAEAPNLTAVQRSFKAANLIRATESRIPLLT